MLSDDERRNLRHLGGAIAVLSLLLLLFAVATVLVWGFGYGGAYMWRGAGVCTGLGGLLFVVAMRLVKAAEG